MKTNISFITLYNYTTLKLSDGYIPNLYCFITLYNYTTLKH